MRCADELLAVTAQVAIAEVVGDDEDHIGRRGAAGAGFTQRPSDARMAQNVSSERMS